MGTITIKATYDADGALRIVVPGATGRPGDEVDVQLSFESAKAAAEAALDSAMQRTRLPEGVPPGSEDLARLAGCLSDPTWVAPSGRRPG